MKELYKKINDALAQYFWPVIVSFGFLSGTFAFFIIFRNNEINDFIKEDLLGSSRNFLILFLAVFIALFIFLGVRYRKKIEERIIPFALIFFGAFVCLKLRSITGGSFIFFAYISFVLTYILSFTLFEKIEEKIKRPKYFLLGTLIFFFLAFAFYSVMKHMKLESNAYDLGIFTQAMYKFSHLDFSENTVRAIENLWGDHFHPILVPFSFPLWLYPKAETIVVIQALMVCLGGIPLYLIARDILKNKIAAVLVVGAYLFFVGIQKAIDFDFHEISLMPAFFFTTFYLMLRKNWKWYFISLIPLLAVKEDVSILVVFLGLYLIIFKRKWLVGLATLLIGGAWFYIATAVIIPKLAAAGFIYFEYSVLGATPKAALMSLITNPLHALYAMYNHPFKANTVWAFLSSFGFLPLLSPAALFMAIPTMGEVMWNDSIYRWQGFHYGASTAPILAIATIYGIYNINFVFGKYFKKDSTVIFLALFALICSFVVSQNDRTVFERLMEPGFYKVPSALGDIKELGKEIPRDAHLSTQTNIVPQFAARDFIYGYPGNRYEQGRQMDYYILSIDAEDNLQNKLVWIWEVENFILNRPEHGIYKQKNGTFLLKKGYIPTKAEADAVLNYLWQQRALINDQIAEEL